MSHTYHKLITHCVFPVKYRQALLQKPWRQEVFAAMGTIALDLRCRPLIINGVEDHVHALIAHPPSLSVSQLMQCMKGKSSKFINDRGFTDHVFEWQRGFGAFSCRPIEIDRLYHYIQNQEQRHRKQTFRKEYLGILKKFEIEHDERYVFTELV